MTIKRREYTDRLMKQAFKAAGVITIALLAGIFFMLLYNSAAFFADVKPVDFFTGSQWDPESAGEHRACYPWRYADCSATGNIYCSISI